MREFRSLEALWQDSRYGLLMLRKNPGFTLVAVISLALGIGANTAIFSFIDAVFLKPLAYQRAERLVEVLEKSPDGKTNIPSPPTFLEWRVQNQVFSHLAAITSLGGNLTLTGIERAERVRGFFVSANYFEMLGVQPVLGRTFYADEDQPGKGLVALLKNSFWQRKFGADPDAIGTLIHLNNESYTIIGVLPAGGVFDREPADVWLPLVFKSEQLRPEVQFFSVLGRLKSDVTIEQANAEMNRLAKGMEQQGLTSKKDYGVVVESLRDRLVRGTTKTTLLLLMGTSLFILLIACANVANLLLTRGAVRQREIAIRAALGASRSRLLQQSLTESVQLALISGGVGIILANWLVKGLTASMPSLVIPTEVEVALDWRVLLFTFSASLLTGILFGLVPAWRATRLDLIRPLQQKNDGASLRFSRNKSRSLLLVSAVVLSFVLVIGATLLIRSFVRLLQVETGFQTDNILTLRTNLDEMNFPQAHQLIVHQEEFVSRIRALPGVVSASVSNALPLAGTSTNTLILIPSGTSVEPGTRTSVAFRTVDTDYFATLGIELLRGRPISERDTAKSPPVIVINQSLAKRYWIDSDPIGAQIQFVGDDFAQLSFTIIGIVADIKHKSLDRSPESEIYVPLAQLPEKATSKHARSLYFSVHTVGDPTALTAAIQAIATSVDKDQPIYGVKTMEQLYSESVAQPRFQTILFSLFGALGLLLAAFGIYGVVAYSVTQRTHEIGLRRALGAQTANVLRLVMGQGMILTLTGLAIGLAGALALTRYLSSFLYEVTPTDAMTFISTSLMFATIALLACYLPARKALKVEPADALKCE